MQSVEKRLDADRRRYVGENKGLCLLVVPILVWLIIHFLCGCIETKISSFSIYPIAINFRISLAAMGCCLSNGQPYIYHSKES